MYVIRIYSVRSKTLPPVRDSDNIKPYLPGSLSLSGEPPTTRAPVASCIPRISIHDPPIPDPKIVQSVLYFLDLLARLSPGPRLVFPSPPSSSSFHTHNDNDDDEYVINNNNGGRSQDRFHNGFVYASRRDTAACQVRGVPPANLNSATVRAPRRSTPGSRLLADGPALPGHLALWHLHRPA